MTAADNVDDLHVEVKRCSECGTGFGGEGAFCPFDGTALESSTWDPTRDPLTATVIDQRYEVIGPLGEGGMGTVYRVRHVTLDRMFAMKVLRRDLASDADLAARFLREAKATAAVRHPSVVTITDFGELDDGAPYFVMELLVGETLATRLRARCLLPPREAADIARKLADGLAAAHAAGVVHRDLKPENVFLVGASVGKVTFDDIRIVDFGAAKIVGGSKLTRPGVVFGTPYYMSPEQAGGEPVDERSDVYSLGVLLYEMITGSVPFEADTYMGVLTKHMFATPTRPSEKVMAAQLGDLETVVMRALEKEPAARYSSMNELAYALDRAIDARPSGGPRRDPHPRPAMPYTAMSTADRIQRSVSRHVDAEQRRKRRSVVVASVSAAATLCMCALAVSVFSEARSSSKHALPPPVLASASAPAPVLASVPTPTPVPSPVPPPAPEPAPVPSPPASSPPIVASAPALTPRPKPPAVTEPRPASHPPRPPSPARPSDELSDPWRR